MITGVETYGLFVQGIALPAEGLIRVDSLANDVYRFDRTSHTLAGYHSGNSFRLGDLVRVAVARVDIGRRELDFRLVGHRPRPKPEARVAVRRGKRKDAPPSGVPRKATTTKSGQRKGNKGKRRL